MTTVYPPIKVEVFLTHGSVLAQEKREGRVKRRTQSNTHTMSRDFWSVACVCVCVCVILALTIHKWKSIKMGEDLG